MSALAQAHAHTASLSPLHTSPQRYHHPRPCRLTNTARLFSPPLSNNHTLVPWSAHTHCHRRFYPPMLSPANTHTHTTHTTYHLCAHHLRTHRNAQTHKYTLTHGIEPPPHLLHTPHAHPLIPTHLHALQLAHLSRTHKHPSLARARPASLSLSLSLALLALALLGYSGLSLPAQAPWKDNGPLTLSQTAPALPLP